jgi:hypothetical protein
VGTHIADRPSVAAVLQQLDLLKPPTEAFTVPDAEGRTPATDDGGG